MRSPIEIAMRDAIVSQIATNPKHNIKLVDATDAFDTTPMVIVREGRPRGVKYNTAAIEVYGRVVGRGSVYGWMMAGVRVDSYIADLMLVFDVADHINGYSYGMFVIECDGHDFHNITKQQASSDRARDRALCQLGIMTLRYTGSDIFRDADACAVDALAVCVENIKRKTATMAALAGSGVAK